MGPVEIEPRGLPQQLPKLLVVAITACVVTCTSLYRWGWGWGWGCGWRWRWGWGWGWGTRAAKIDPMSPKPLPPPGSFAASFAAVVFVFSFFFSLQKPLCSGQAAIWHAAQQYATRTQPEHILNVTHFLGSSPHSPHKTISGCVDDDEDDMALLCLNWFDCFGCEEGIDSLSLFLSFLLSTLLAN
jgi:hypothetical protein